MIELETALEEILQAIPAAELERVPLCSSAGRILGADIIAVSHLPPFNNSAVDGYAVRAADVLTASLEKPVRLQLVGRLPAGGSYEGRISTGECLRIFTGGALPQGADAVVMQEDVRTSEDQPNHVWICDSASLGQSVRLRGEDVQCGDVIGSKGTKLTPGRKLLLAASGVSEAIVGRQPVIGLIATGSELCEVGKPLSAGQIYECNRTALETLVQVAGGVSKVYPLVPDSLPATQAALRTAFTECDIVVTSGGVSVGELDFVKLAFESLGGALEFWKIAIRPGKPFAFGRLGKRYLCGLPGNPASAFVTFLLLVRPAILRWQGALETGLRLCPGVLGESLSNPGDRRHFIRVRMREDGRVVSSGLQASHALASLAAATGLLDLAAGARIDAGERVMVLQVN